MAASIAGVMVGMVVIVWLFMRGALNERVKKVHQNYYLPMTTAMAVALFE